MRIETKNTIQSIIKNRNTFKSPTQEIFKNEKEFQIWLARELKKFGFKVYLDKKVCEIPSFKGDREKPDILCFFEKNYKNSKVINFDSPIAIEIKARGKNNKFNNISKAILQVKKYFGKRYFTEQWEGEISYVVLAIDDLILKNKIYDWGALDSLDYHPRSFCEGIYWGMVRLLFTISNKAGFLGWDGEYFTIQTPNVWFRLLNGGNIGYKPNSYNCGGKLNVWDSIEKND